jgi:hypothetical protein
LKPVVHRVAVLAPALAIDLVGAPGDRVIWNWRKGFARRSATLSGRFAVSAFAFLT